MVITVSTKDIPNASETLPGLVERATQVEVDTGTDTDRFVSPATLAAAATGKVLQVIQTSLTSVVSGNSNSWTTVAGLSVTITPSSTSSKILIFSSLCYAGPTTNNAMVRLARGSTGIGVGDAAGSRTQAAFKMGRAHGEANESGNIIFLDSPATTSATTYNIQARSSIDTLTWYFNRQQTDNDLEENARGASTIIAVEIEG